MWHLLKQTTALFLSESSGLWKSWRNPTRVTHPDVSDHPPSCINCVTLQGCRQANHTTLSRELVPPGPSLPAPSRWPPSLHAMLPPLVHTAPGSCFEIRCFNCKTLFGLPRGAFIPLEALPVCKYCVPQYWSLIHSERWQASDHWWSIFSCGVAS